MLASLTHYWRSHLPVALAAAVTTAVLSGALLVGDSMRFSLRALTLGRLGAIDQVLVGQGFFRQALADELGGMPVILLQGSVTAPGDGRRASRVGIQGVPGNLTELYGQEEPFDFTRGERQFFPSVAINDVLAQELGISRGDELVLRLSRPSDVPRETLMGSTEVDDLVASLRVVVREVLSGPGPGRFGLAASQSVPSNVFVALEELQRALDRPGRINAVLFAPSAGSGEAQNAAALEERLRHSLQLDDLGLELRTQDDFSVLASREILFPPALEQLVRDELERHGAPTLEVSTYLANLVVPATPEPDGAAPEGEESARRYVPYSTISALPLPPPPAFGELRTVSGGPAPALRGDQVLVNEWAARELGVGAGDRVRMQYWQVGERERLILRTRELEVAGVVALRGLGADALLAPEFPGVADAEDMSEWEPTFPVDLSLVRDQDELYWDRYRATPKFFVTPELGRELWANERFGWVSSFRVAGQGPASVASLADGLRDGLAAKGSLAALGFALQPVRSQGLEAARGATDFGGLFIGFSLFLIVSALLLVGLFFRLGVERRAAEIGVRLAIGERARKVLRRFLMEGLLVSGVGIAAGSALALGYAALMMLGLRTLWRGAVGVSTLELHVAPTSVVLGAVASLLCVGLAIWLAFRRLLASPVPRLLRGEGREPEDPGGTRRLVWTLRLALIAAVAMAAGSFAAPESRAAPLFFGVGASALVAGLAAVALALRRSFDPLAGGPLGRVVAMAAASAGRNPGRSLACIGLVAAATFTIVAVGAYGRDFSRSAQERESGTGGFQLVAEADTPLFVDLGTAEGRAELGFEAREEELLADATVVSFRVRPGDDVSCLNLYQPQRPRLFGVPASLRERGGFSFQAVAEDVENPWQLLDRQLDDGAIPAIGDYNSVLWILKSGLGKDVLLEDGAGRPLRLRLVGLLHKSLFQSELLIAEEQFVRLFPAEPGYRAFLFETDADAPQLEGLLERRLDDFGFDASSTVERLERFQAVENTYLATFRNLGGLGLLLGTVGLAVILLRNVLERSRELAALRAIGYRRTTLAWIVFAENALLLAIGIVLGTSTALLAVAPHLLGGEAVVPWSSLFVSLLAVFATGAVACAAAVRTTLRLPLLETLRTE